MEEVLAPGLGATLVHADPPWTYEREAGGANPRHRRNGEAPLYAVLGMSAIAGHVDLAFAAAAPDARLALWCTWPMLGDWMDAVRSSRWRYMTGGSWHKRGGVGVGYHWRGRSEPVLVYAKGAPACDGDLLLNAHESVPGDHSEKPEEWLAGILRRWTEPGDLVIDMYAGLAPMARACLAEGRRYVGAEIDPARHAVALARLARSQRRGL